MDYVLGSVAALVTGNVTPNRPRLLKRALTPTKHQASPNVTPKSEFVEDRSIFLSPSMQKKKAIVKKSPKRIFQNPDLETTDNGEGNLSLTSPKADKVKKHLKDELESESLANKSATENTKSPKKGKKKRDSITPELSNQSIAKQNSNENTPKKKKNKLNSVSESAEPPAADVPTTDVSTSAAKSPKKMKDRRKSLLGNDSNKENDSKIEPQTSINNNKSPNKQKNKEKSQTDQKPIVENVNNAATKKKNKKRKKKPKGQANEVNTKSTENIDTKTESTVENKDTNIAENMQSNQEGSKKKKNKKRKNKGKQPPIVDAKSELTENVTENTTTENVAENQSTMKKKNRKRKTSKSEPEAMDIDEPAVEAKEPDESETQSKKSKTTVNPNAITNEESDSEHESDDEIESENEEINKKVFEAEQKEESSDEEEEQKEAQPQKEKVKKKKETEDTTEKEVNTEEDIKRTLFVGNVPFSAKCKKEIKKIFNKHGQIETIRIRTVPVKDGRYTPKLAVIKNELHPERTTVNVYVKYKDEESVEKALSENNTVLNEHHLRVSRSSHSGAEHDPKCSVFVGNLPFAMEDEALRQKFENCGEIESVRIIRDKKTNAGKGFGYVNFSSKDGVELALALTEEDLTIKNRIVRVKRCTLLTNKQKQDSNKPGFKKQFNQKSNQNQRIQTPNQGGNRPSQGGQRPFQGGNRPNQGGQRPFQGGNRPNQGGQRPFQGGNRPNQGGQRPFQGGNRPNQGGQRFQGGPRSNQGGQRFQDGQNFQGDQDGEGRDGAHRRIMNKRKNQETNSSEPPNKKQKNITQPNKEKKSRKEFVGMTAEKKKKRKFDKGQKKKKALSEILTK